MNYIWDLDGTLFDSYPVITSDSRETLARFGIEKSRDEVNEGVLKDSVGGYLNGFASALGVDREEVMSYYHSLALRHWDRITLMEGAKEALQGLIAQGGRHFVYTHRGESSYWVMKKLGIWEFFDDVVTAEDGFKRKPSPDAVNYLAEKHTLDKARTYYVGDRVLDMGCAVNAGIKGILFLREGTPVTPDGNESYTVKQLTDIMSIK